MSTSTTFVPAATPMFVALATFEDKNIIVHIYPVLAWADVQSQLYPVITDRGGLPLICYMGPTVPSQAWYLAESRMHAASGAEHHLRDQTPGTRASFPATVL